MSTQGGLHGRVMPSWDDRPMIQRSDLLLTALLSSGLSLVASARWGREPDPPPAATERDVDWWLTFDAEGASPILVERRRIVFRAHSPEVRIRLTNRREGESVPILVEVENLNRDVVEPIGCVDSSWISPTTIAALCEVTAGRTVDFLLRDRHPGRPARFFVASDPELNFPVLDRLLERARRERPDFVWILGDLVQERGWMIEEYARCFEEAEVPVYAVPGNHDLVANRGEPPWEGRLEPFRRVFGPSHWTFEFRGAQYVVLDTAGHSLGAEQLDWLERTVAAGPRRPRLVLTHKPFADPRPGEDHVLEDPIDRARLIGLLRPVPDLVYYCGHIESCRTYEWEGIPVRIVGTLTFESKMAEESEASNGYFEVCVEPGALPAEARVELSPSTPLEIAGTYVFRIWPVWLDRRPSGGVGLAIVLVSILAIGRRLVRRGVALRRESRLPVTA